MVGQVRPRRPHLLAGDPPAVTVPLGAGGERRQVGPGAGLAEQLAPHLLVPHDRREVPQPLLLGAVGEQGGRRRVEAQGVEAPEVVGGQLGLDRLGHDHADAEPAVLDRPGRHDQARRPEHGTRPRSRPGSAPADRPARRRPAPPATRPARGRRPRPGRAGRQPGPGRAVPTSMRRCCVLVVIVLEGRWPLVAEGGQALAEVLAARRQLQRQGLVLQLVVERGGLPGPGSHLVKPRATVGLGERVHGARPRRPAHR